MRISHHSHTGPRGACAKVRLVTSKESTSNWLGELTLSPGMVVYQGPGGSAAEHSHHAIQLIRSFDTTFRLELGDCSVACHSALVPSGTPHAFESDAERLIIALIEPLGPRGSQIDSFAEENLGVCLDDHVNSPPSGDSLDIAHATIDDLLPIQTSPPEMSDHVLAALTYLDEAIEGKPKVEEAAQAAGISPSRLSHLFTEQVGIPFRNYVLWLRLRRVVDEVADGSNLTRAALAAGFSDSSHLSRVFRDNFGLAPSALQGMTVAPDRWPSVSGS